MKDPRSNYALVQMYYAVGQFAKATELLSVGLRNNSIASTEQNWRILAYCYQQINENEKAIEVYKEAADRLLDSAGMFDYYIADIYRQLDKETDAFDYYTAAAEKNHLASSMAYATYLNIAFAGYELHKYDEALKACDEAAKYPGGGQGPAAAQYPPGHSGRDQPEKGGRPAGRPRRDGQPLTPTPPLCHEEKKRPSTSLSCSSRWSSSLPTIGISTPATSRPRRIPPRPTKGRRRPTRSSRMIFA